MKEIPLTQGKFSIVNDIDYAFLMQRKWYFSKGYAVRHSRKSDGFHTRKSIYMHRIVLSRKLGHSDFENGDHKNRERLDNRRGNLRPATYPQDKANTKIRGGSSKFKGVCWRKDKKKWHVQIGFHGSRNRHVGYFNDEIEAAKAYNKVALEYFGNFACVNSV